MLFTLSDAMNPCKRSYTFEQWYMFYFHDLQLWERGSGPPSRKPFTRLSATYTNSASSKDAASALSSWAAAAWSSLGASPSSSVLGTSAMMDDPDAQVIEVANRVCSLARVSKLKKAAH